MKGRIGLVFVCMCVCSVLFVGCHVDKDEQQDTVVIKAEEAFPCYRKSIFAAIIVKPILQKRRREYAGKDGCEA